MLVHSPLVGAATWEAVAAALRDREHEVLVPDLAGSLADGPPYWSRQVDAITDAAAGQQVILVGHSAAGPLLAAAGAALDRAAAFVFVNAGLPLSRAGSTRHRQNSRTRCGLWPRTGGSPPRPDWWGADGLAGICA